MAVQSCLVPSGCKATQGNSTDIDPKIILSHFRSCKVQHFFLCSLAIMGNHVTESDNHQGRGCSKEALKILLKSSMLAVSMHPSLLPFSLLRVQLYCPVLDSYQKDHHRDVCHYFYFLSGIGHQTQSLCTELVLSLFTF